MMLSINPFQNTACPYCRKTMNRIGSMHKEKPFPGAFVMCAECNGLSVMNDDLSLRSITAEELAILMCDETAIEQLAQFAHFADWRKRMHAALNN